MDYVILTDEQRREMVRNRVLTLESEHYQHTLNLAALDAPTGDHDDPGRVANRKTTRDAIASIEAAHVLALTELKRLPAPTGDEPAPVGPGTTDAARDAKVSL